LPNCAAVTRMRRASMSCSVLATPRNPNSTHTWRNVNYIRHSDVSWRKVASPGRTVTWTSSTCCRLALNERPEIYRGPFTVSSNELLYDRWPRIPDRSAFTGN
jgi:hypothetical protein